MTYQFQYKIIEWYEATRIYVIFVLVQTGQLFHTFADLVNRLEHDRTLIGWYLILPIDFFLFWI